jgi:hypothetical protein
MESDDLEVVTVPHRRCETCTNWVRVRATALVGGCHFDPNMEDWDHQSQIRRVIAFTTDLSLCSGWKPKQE